MITPIEGGILRSFRGGKLTEKLMQDDMLGDDEVMSSVRSRFVNDETDAATIRKAFYDGGEGGAQEGDAAYGDFEDLETGETFGNVEKGG